MRIDITNNNFFEELCEKYYLNTIDAISKKWDELVKSLKYYNRFFPDQSFTDLFSRFVHFEEELPNQTILYRARILDRELYKHLKFEDYNLQGLPSDMMSSPPLGMAHPGRANPKGVSYLYLANTIETACAEVRPIRNDCISISRFSISSDLKIINLHKELSDTLYHELGGENVGFFYALQNAFMKPYRANDEQSYFATQYIASYLQHIGYDGIKYRSAHNSSYDAYNVVLFDPETAKCIDEYGQIYTCLSSSLTFQNIATDGSLTPRKEEDFEKELIKATAVTEEYLSSCDKTYIQALILEDQKVEV